jgi:hypothetical protein
MLTISAQALGRKKPLFADWSVPLPPELHDGGVSLRDVISRIVRHEIAAFRKRRSQRQFIRVLSSRQIEDAAEQGKIAPGDSAMPVHELDDDAAVGTALQAFEDGLYLVVIDDQEQRSLNNQVFLHPDSRITFIRLALLAGG